MLLFFVRNIDVIVDVAVSCYFACALWNVLEPKIKMSAKSRVSRYYTECNNDE